ncbi:MAG: glycosyltransferase family 39 protein [Sulfurospirillum sp.]|nr:glycosyltransferase family 39 protein [Sulfurospirillum sp.]
MREITLIFLIIFVNTIFLLFAINGLSIHAQEALIYFEGVGFLHVITHFFTSVLGQNDFALRLPFLLLHVGSLVLLYKIAKPLLKHKIDRVVSVGIYALLPGVNSAALLVDPAGIVIFVTLLFVYLYMQCFYKSAFTVLVATLFIDNAFAILYLSLFFYAIHKREKPLIFLSLTLFTLCMYAYGFDTGGKPKGYFLDTLGVYAAIFSPLLFLYFIYALYRILIKEEKNLLWFISFSALLLSLLLSFRQKLHIEEFAPFVVLAIPLMVRVFYNSFRVRLPIHRRYHKILFIVIFSSLAFNFALSVFNKPLYGFVQDPKKHFSYDYHIAKDLAQKLKDNNINYITTSDDALQLRLKFYGIKSGNAYKLTSYPMYKKEQKTFKITYAGVLVKTFYLY